MKQQTPHKQHSCRGAFPSKTCNDAHPQQPHRCLVPLCFGGITSAGACIHRLVPGGSSVILDGLAHVGRGILQQPAERGGGWGRLSGWWPQWASAAERYEC